MLSIEPLGLLGPDLIIPKMENLRKLELFGTSNQFPGESEDFDMFSPPFEMAVNFPNLKQLTVYNRNNVGYIFRTSQQLKPMPSIEVLAIVGNLSVECEGILLKATPNVTKLYIIERTINNTQDFINLRLIANCLPKLQSLKWFMRRSTHHVLFHSLDAAITGLPVKFCEKLSKEYRNKDSLSAAELAWFELKQRTASILDLKELREFTVNFHFNEATNAEMQESPVGGCFVQRDDEAGFSPGDTFYETGFSKVSKFLAFDLMPNLNVRTHKGSFGFSV